LKNQCEKSRKQVGFCYKGWAEICNVIATTILHTISPTTPSVLHHKEVARQLTSFQETYTNRCENSILLIRGKCNAIKL